MGGLVLASAYRLIDMLLAEGALEVLSAVKQGRTAHFKDLRVLKNERTNHVFSGNTLSARLKELEKLGAIKRIISVTDKGRNVVAYSITPNGIKTLEISQRYEEELSRVLSGSKA